MSSMSGNDPVAAMSNVENYGDTIQKVLNKKKYIYKDTTFSLDNPMDEEVKHSQDCVSQH